MALISGQPSNRCTDEFMVSETTDFNVILTAQYISEMSCFDCMYWYKQQNWQQSRGKHTQTFNKTNWHYLLIKKNK